MATETLPIFRVHFADTTQPPIDVPAEDAKDARDKAEKRRRGIITKVKLLREAN